MRANVPIRSVLPVNAAILKQSTIASCFVFLVFFPFVSHKISATVSLCNKFSSLHLCSRALKIMFRNNIVLPRFPELMGVRFQRFCAWLCQESVLGRVNEGRNQQGLVAWCRPYLGHCPNFHGLK